MGGVPWFYFVDYQPDINAALQRLREREFNAGRYNPVMPFPPFPVNPQSPAPGARHDSIEKALKASDADGTRSILDMMQISATPDCFAVTPLPKQDLLSLFGTEKPTHEQVEQNFDLFELLERGQGVYIVVYESGQPSEIFFAGYSFD